MKQAKVHNIRGRKNIQNISYCTVTPVLRPLAKIDKEENSKSNLASQKAAKIDGLNFARIGFSNLTIKCKTSS